jgi:hypothetical protein
MIPIILAILTAFLPLQDTPEKLHPWSGHFWKYRNTDGKLTRISVSRSCTRVRYQGKEVRVQSTTWMGREAFLLEKPGETWILVEGVVGKNGEKGNVLRYIFRWKGEKKWSFNRVSGCIAWKVACAREGVATVAGIRCTRFRIGKETWWISREKGVLKCSRKDGTWTGTLTGMSR